MSEEQGEVTSSSLLAAAQEYDTQKEAGIDEPQVEVMQLEPKAEEPEGIAEEEAAPKIDDVQNEESSLTEQPEEVAPEEPKSKYAKNRKRLDDAWKSANDAKESNKQEKAKLDAERAEIEKMREKVTADQGYRDEHGHTAKDYDDAAEGFIEGIRTRKSDRSKLKSSRRNTPNYLIPIRSCSKKSRGLWRPILYCNMIPMG